MTRKRNDDFQAFKALVIEEFNELYKMIDSNDIYDAADMIKDAQSKGNRVHISGIGKPAYVAGYVASLLSSTGTPTYFLHGTEAVHGSCGQLVAGDVVIFISNSGKTAEMQATVNAVKRNNCKVIGVTGDNESWLARQSDVHLFAGVSREGGHLNRAPRMSVLAEMFVLQSLSVVLQADLNLTVEQYVLWHPSGSLGELSRE